MNFTLKILGTASALPTVDRYPSAQVLDVRGRLFLIDCGEGAQMQMRRMKISPLKIEAVFISHIHGDHLFGLFGLLSTMGMLGRTGVLKIFAPKSFGPILKFFLSYFGEGMKYEVDFHPLSVKLPETVFATRVLEVLAFPLNHRIDTFGYLFREKTPMLNVKKECIEKYGLTLAEIGVLKRGEDVVRDSGVIPNSEAAYLPYVPRSYAYCSDTAPVDGLADWIRGVDLLYHEATFPDSMKEMAAATCHSTTLQAAKCALDAGAGKLLIGHFSSRFPDLSEFEKETASIFPDSSLAVEGGIYDIPLTRLQY